jgi:asparagine synthase (glutamine-hydrolysing)
MCGICGVAFMDNGKTPDPTLLAAMTDAMAKRGPDGKGFHLSEGVGLGVCRLSIIDLETGDQPISNEDGTVTVACNGEIYDHVELRRELAAAGHLFRTESDTEVIAHLYEEHGPEFVVKLRGMFGLAVWDAAKHRLLLARDRLGIKPMHFAAAKEALYFASEQKSITAGVPVDARLDISALKDLFTWGFVTGSRTLFKGIRRLLPGTYLLYQDGAVAFHKYWEVRFPLFDASPRISAGQWAEALREKLWEVVGLHLRSDVPVGAFLSGGLDSSSVAALAARQISTGLQTFSLAFEDPAFDEMKRNKTLDRFPDYGLIGRQTVCRTDDFARLPEAAWQCENLSTIGMEIPRMRMAEIASEHVKTVLAGEGADEIFGGYERYRRDALRRRMLQIMPLRRVVRAAAPLIENAHPILRDFLLPPPNMECARFQQLIGFHQPWVAEDLLAPDLRGEYAGCASPCEEEVKPPADFASFDPFTQLQYFEMKLRLPDFVNHIVDRTSMGSSLEVRLPFLDHELVELCARIPPDLKLKGLQEKYILRAALRGALPEEIRLRPKRGLSAPRDKWLAGKLPSFAKEMFSQGYTRKKGYFNPAAVARLVERHHSKNKRSGWCLMGVLAIHLWDELFLRGASPDSL